MQINKSKIVLIGSGEFIEKTILPALLINHHSFEIIAIINKSGALSSEINRLKNDIKVFTNITDIAADSFDTLFICVPQKAIVTVLSQLLKEKLIHKKVLLSTPCIPLNQLKKITLLKKFSNIQAFEFVPLHRKYAIAKNIIDQGNIGQIKRIIVNHSGYLYHGIATLRYLATKETISSIKSYSFGAYNEYQIKFRRRILASITEPKDYNAGSLMIAGNNGVISDYPLAISNNYCIKCITDENNIFSHFEVNGEIQPLTPIEQKATEVLPEISFQNIQRQLFIIAAAELFELININKNVIHHQCYETIYEHLIVRISKKIGLYYNPFSWLKASFLKIILAKLTSQ